MRRVWIEIFAVIPKIVSQSSPSMRRVWIEILFIFYNRYSKGRSPSMRRVWIEIKESIFLRISSSSHPPCGGCGLKSVGEDVELFYNKVTLHAEGVD